MLRKGIPVRAVQSSTDKVTRTMLLVHEQMATFYLEGRVYHPVHTAGV